MLWAVIGSLHKRAIKMPKRAAVWPLRFPMVIHLLSPVT